MSNAIVDLRQRRREWRMEIVRQNIALKGFKDKKRKGRKKMYKTEEQTLSKIGGSEQFKDSILDKSYVWETKAFAEKYSLLNRVPAKMRSLKELSAMKIAENSLFLSKRLLRTGNWSQWRLVWHQISLQNNDTFEIFDMFAAVFHSEPTFSCHGDILSCPQTKKRVILSSILPNSQRHRVERLFGNVSISQFVQTINHCEFQNLVVLELSSSRIQQSDLLELTNLKNLTSLKVALIQPTDSTIHTWCTSLRASKWPKLQLLSLPDLSKLAVTKLQEVAKCCKLMFIEVTQTGASSSLLNIRRDWPDVDYSNWHVIDDPRLNQLDWGVKTLSILRKFKIDNHTEVPNSITIILDFNALDILNEHNNDDDVWLDFEKLWNSTSNNSKYYQALVLKNKLNTKETATNLKRPSILKKRKIASMQAFFDL